MLNVIKKIVYTIILWYIVISSIFCKAQTGKKFIFHSTKNEQNGISSATNLPGGKFAYAYSSQYFFKIIIADTNGNELLSRNFSGEDLDNIYIIYHKGYLYGVTTSYIDGDSALRKASLVFMKLDTCLNLITSKLVYNRNPIESYMYIQPSSRSNIGLNDNSEFFFSILNITKINTESIYRNMLVIFDTLINIQFSPYYYAFETTQCEFHHGRYSLSGNYYQVNKDNTKEYLKPFYSEMDPVTKEFDMWVIDRYNDSIFGYLSGIYHPEKTKMYVSLGGNNLGNAYTHGEIDYQTINAAKYFILSDTSFSIGTHHIVPNWPSSGKFVVIEESSLKTSTIQHGQIKTSMYNEKLKQLVQRKIYGWGNLNNGLDDTFTMITWGSKILSNNKLFVFGETRDDYNRMRSFYYVLDSNLNFATKTIDTSKYQCGKIHTLPAMKISPKDTFFLTNEMFKEANINIHDIKLRTINYTASIPFDKPFEQKKSKHLLIKYLPNNDIECDLHGINTILHYKIYDISAKEVSIGTSCNNKIVLKQNDFKPGIYILNVINHNEYFAEKIQIK